MSSTTTSCVPLAARVKELARMCAFVGVAIGCGIRGSQLWSGPGTFAAAQIQADDADELVVQSPVTSLAEFISRAVAQAPVLPDPTPTATTVAHLEPLTAAQRTTHGWLSGSRDGTWMSRIDVQPRWIMGLQTTVGNDDNSA